MIVVSSKTGIEYSNSFCLPDALLNLPSGVCFLLEYSISPFPKMGSYGANVAIVQTESLWKNAPPGV